MISTQLTADSRQVAYFSMEIRSNPAQRAELDSGHF